jgi:hypothetical protein
MKTSGQVTSAVSTAAASARQKNLVESSACLLVGTRISTGAAFYLTFPNQSALTQWLTTGDGADIDVWRVEAIMVFIS